MGCTDKHTTDFSGMPSTTDFDKDPVVMTPGTGSKAFSLFRIEMNQESIDEFVADMILQLQGNNCFVDVSGGFYMQCFMKQDELNREVYSIVIYNNSYIWRKRIYENDIEAPTEYWFDYKFNGEAWESTMCDFSALPYTTCANYLSELKKVLSDSRNNFDIRGTYPDPESNETFPTEYVLDFTEDYPTIKKACFLVKSNSDSTLERITIVYPSGSHIEIWQSNKAGYEHYRDMMQDDLGVASPFS